MPSACRIRHVDVFDCGVGGLDLPAPCSAAVWSGLIAWFCHSLGGFHPSVLGWRYS